MSLWRIILLKWDSLVLALASSGNIWLSVEIKTT